VTAPELTKRMRAGRAVRCAGGAFIVFGVALGLAYPSTTNDVVLGLITAVSNLGHSAISLHFGAGEVAWTLVIFALVGCLLGVFFHFNVVRATRAAGERNGVEAEDRGAAR